MSEDELLSAYLDGDLTPADRARVEAMLGERADLKEMHDDLVALRGEWAALPRVAAPPQLAARIQQAIAATVECAPVATKATPLIEPREAEKGSAWSPLFGLAGAGVLAASLALALAAPQWFSPAPVDSNVALHQDPPAPGPSRPTAERALTKAENRAHETFNEETKFAAQAAPAAQPAPAVRPPAAAIAKRQAAEQLAEQQVQAKAAAAPPAPGAPDAFGFGQGGPGGRGGVAGPAARPIGPDADVRQGSKPADLKKALDRDADGAGNPSVGNPAAAAPGPITRALPPRPTREPDVIVLDAELPPGVTAEQAIEQLVAAGNVVLSNDSARGRKLQLPGKSGREGQDKQIDAEKEKADRKGPDRNGAVRADALVMELGEQNASRVLAAIEGWKAVRKNREFRRIVPFAKLETDLDAVADGKQQYQFSEGNALGAAPPANRGAYGGGGAGTESLEAGAEAAGAKGERGWAMIVPAAEAASLTQKSENAANDHLARNAALPGAAAIKPGDEQPAPALKPQALRNDHFGAGGSGAKDPAKDEAPVRRKLVIRLHAAGDSAKR